MHVYPFVYLPVEPVLTLLSVAFTSSELLCVLERLPIGYFPVEPVFAPLMVFTSFAGCLC